MYAELVAIGDELTSGQRLDTNSPWLAQRLAELGIRVLFHTTVGDDLAANVRVFRQAVERVEIVVATGGLGPTADDLTREALAHVLGKPLVLDQASLAHIQALFARRKREMPERNVVQAMFPEGSSPLANPHGTAPGIDVRIVSEGRTCRLFALPGVPAEMREMWQVSVAPQLAALPERGACVVRHKSIRCFGVGESELERMLPDLIRRGRVPTVGITASQTTLTLRITAEGASAEDCERLMAPTVATIKACLGTLIFGEGEEELQHAVVRLLRDRGQTVATVEIGSGGTMASWLSEADDERRAFAGGLVLREGAERRVLLDATPAITASKEFSSAVVWSDLLDRRFSQFAAWPEVVTTFARRLREALSADYGLAIGPFPQSDAANTAAGQVHVGLATSTEMLMRSFPFAGHPDAVKARAMKQALDWLRLRMLGVD